MTKICVSSVGTDLDAQMDPRFGRCAYFVIVDSETMDFETVKNDGVMASGGAGIQAAQTIVSKGVDVLITGGVGPNAHGALQSSGVKIVTSSSVTVRAAVEAFKSGALSDVTKAGPAHVGMGGGMGAGSGGGMGMGRGMGRGRGGGRGRGQGGGWGQRGGT